jgi:hypothetical protein
MTARCAAFVEFAPEIREIRIIGHAFPSPLRPFDQRVAGFLQVVYPFKS